MYGASDDLESVATIHAALDRGVDLIDTGDFYGSGHNEMLIGRALRDRRDRARLSVKFGALRTPDGRWSGVDTRPVAVRNFLAYSLNRLGVDHVDIYRPTRLDPAVPIEETVGALAKGPGIVPVIGARTRAQLEESLGALAVSLSPEDVALLEAAVPASAVAGTRYPEPQMQMLDSEPSRR
jgi:aryl-alcohol dehydrogenase-like predicted oxidoreductase